MREANVRSHTLATLEHLLLALLDEPDAARLLQACRVNLDELGSALKAFLDDDLASLVSDVDTGEAEASNPFQRVIQRAAIHVQSSGRPAVTGANVLVAIFAERESHAAYLLQDQDMTRYDAVNFIAHGVAKDPAYSETRPPLAPWPDETQGKLAEERLTEAEWRAKFEAQRSTSSKYSPEDDKGVSTTVEPFLFLSYSHEDREIARGVLTRIENQGLPFWWDQSIAPGDEWRARIAEQLENATVVLTLWTKNSSTSKAVIEEASTAQAKRKLVHARMDNSKIPYGFSETQYVDLRDWDGSQSHPSFQRLLFAIQDRLNAPTVSFVTQRIHESSPVEIVAYDGRLAVKDAPANAPAAVINPLDLETRLTGLRQTVGTMCRICADNTVYQLPPTLHHCLEAIQTAANTLPVTWYALEDAKVLLNDCMVSNFAAESWNSTVVNGLANLIVRIDEMRPLLEPIQIDPVTNAARPPVPEPVVTEEDIPDVISLTEEARFELASEDARIVIDENTERLIESALHQMHDLQASQDQGKLFKFRRALKNATYIVGGLVTAIGTGVVINLLTAPAAAQTLLLRLKPILDNLLQFFL